MLLCDQHACSWVCNVSGATSGLPRSPQQLGEDPGSVSAFSLTAAPGKPTRGRPFSPTLGAETEPCSPPLHRSAPPLACFQHHTPRRLSLPGATVIRAWSLLGRCAQHHRWPSPHVPCSPRPALGTPALGTGHSAAHCPVHGLRRSSAWRLGPLSFEQPSVSLGWSGRLRCLVSGVRSARAPSSWPVQAPSVGHSSVSPHLAGARCAARMCRVGWPALGVGGAWSRYPRGALFPP